MALEQPEPGVPKQSLTAAEDETLTPTEFRLWQALRSQPGHVFRRSDLVALVMPDALVLERTIDVHIKSLRKKLGPLARQIETVRKVGYRLNREQETEPFG